MSNIYTHPEPVSPVVARRKVSDAQLETLSLADKENCLLTHEQLQREFFKLAKAHNKLCAYITELEVSGRIRSSREVMTFTI